MFIRLRFLVCLEGLTGLALVGLWEYSMSCQDWDFIAM